jgi:phage replication O-like protein O
MANPQKENGFTPIANEVVEQLVKLRIPASEKDILFFVIRKTYGYHKKEDRISLTQFELGTLLSRVTVVKALKNLISRNILVKSGLLFRFNKNYESWVVNAGILVKSENIFGKGGYTKSGKGGYTYKRKKDMTKDNSEQSSQEIVFLIESFSKLNPACKRMYGNKTQRQACSDLIGTYGYERILSVIDNTLPKTNILQFFPTITTPLQLRDKWVLLESAIKRYQSEHKKLKASVAF